MYRFSTGVCTDEREIGAPAAKDYCDPYEFTIIGRSCSTC
jgi:hypothetical protein